MAKRQTRRTVSMTRAVYEAAKKEAARRGQTLAGFIEIALAAQGVPIADHPRQTPTQVHAHPVQKAKRVDARRNDTKPRRVIATPVAERVAAPPTPPTDHPAPVLTPPKAEPKPEPMPAKKRPSLERQMLGDGVANAFGFD